MKLRVPRKAGDKPSPTLAVSVEGKSYPVNQGKDNPSEYGIVELPNTIPPATLKHLFSLGWLLADEVASKVARDAGADLNPQGQPIVEGGNK
jgi:hypothetical protein